MVVAVGRRKPAPGGGAWLQGQGHPLQVPVDGHFAGCPQPINTPASVNMKTNKQTKNPSEIITETHLFENGSALEEHTHRRKPLVSSKGEENAFRGRNEDNVIRCFETVLFGQGGSDARLSRQLRGRCPCGSFGLSYICGLWRSSWFW